jgi:hypothetical protein
MRYESNYSSTPQVRLSQPLFRPSVRLSEVFRIRGNSEGGGGPHNISLLFKGRNVMYFLVYKTRVFQYLTLVDSDIEEILK